MSAEHAYVVKHPIALPLANPAKGMPVNMTPIAEGVRLDPKKYDPEVLEKYTLSGHLDKLTLPTKAPAAPAKRKDPKVAPKLPEVRHLHTATRLLQIGTRRGPVYVHPGQLIPSDALGQDIHRLKELGLIKTTTTKF